MAATCQKCRNLLSAPQPITDGLPGILYRVCNSCGYSRAVTQRPRRERLPDAAAEHAPRTLAELDGVKLGAMTPAERKMVTTAACQRLEAELKASAPAIAKVLDSFVPTRPAPCDRGPSCRFVTCLRCGDPDYCTTHHRCGTCYFEGD
jgi:DNA-directed RNA polymerase subunit M/transcription elongation factor TFIIS